MISIITLTYNNLETSTKPFISSILENTSDMDYELIIIDNFSKDGTVEYLHAIQTIHSNIRVIFNPANLGYSKGNNQGLKLAKGDILCLVNNDVLFSPNWLKNLVSVVSSHPEIGLASPTVNEPGDRYSVRNYNELFERHKQQSAVEFEYTCSSSFCCVCMRRDVFEKVGYLDEEFSPAYYEDDDYCLRVLYQGYKNAVLKNTFIFHNHCQTSGKMPDRDEIRKRNRNYYYQKHIIAQYIGALRDENVRLRKHTLFNRLKKIVIEIICVFILNKEQKKKFRTKLKWKLNSL